jgi:hypothetical protein
VPQRGVEPLRPKAVDFESPRELSIGAALQLFFAETLRHFAP